MKIFIDPNFPKSIYYKIFEPKRSSDIISLSTLISSKIFFSIISSDITYFNTMPSLNPLEIPPRVSRAGRFVKGSYHNDTPLHIIADISSPTQTREIEEEKIKKTAINAIFLMRKANIIIIDILKYQIYGDDDKERKTIREFMRNGGVLMLMKLYINEFEYVVKSEICSLAQIIYQKEFEQLHRSSVVR